MMRWSRCFAAALALVPAVAFAPTLRRAPPPSAARRAKLDADDAVRAEAALLAAIDAQRPIPAIASLFAALERACPAPEDLLDDPSGLDGPWDLEWTVAQRTGDDDAALLGGGADAAPGAAAGAEGAVNAFVPGAVNASGVTVDAERARNVVQRFDVGAARVANEVDVTPWLRLIVAGPYAPTGVARRASVKFDTLELRLAGGRANPLDGATVLRTGLPFEWLYRLRPDEKESWLETTVLSPRVRLGRGNKGSLFVLTRGRGDAAGEAE